MPQVYTKVIPNLVDKLGPQGRVMMTFKLILEALWASKGTQFPAHDVTATPTFYFCIN